MHQNRKKWQSQIVNHRVILTAGRGAGCDLERDDMRCMASIGARLDFLDAALWGRLSHRCSRLDSVVSR